MWSRLRRIKSWEELANVSRYSPKALAKTCCVSLRQLERFFVQEKGKSPYQWLNELRMEKSLGLLQSGLLVKEVAGRLGYKQTAHFSRQFTRHYGVSPLEAQAILFEMSVLDVKCRDKVRDLASQQDEVVTKSSSFVRRTAVQR